MKKLVAITGAILICCTVISAAASTKYQNSEASCTIYNETENTSNFDNENYILKSVNGNLVVYLADGVTVYLDTEKNVSSLPHGDKLRLEQGIEVHSTEKLKKLLEDYVS